MKIHLSIVLILLLFSCGMDQQGLKTADEISSYIQERYKTKNVSCTFGTNGKQKYYTISVAKSAEINKSERNPEMYASDIALHLFDFMEESERKTYDLFTVKITQRNHTIEISYRNETMQKAKENLLYIDGFLKAIEDKEYVAAESKFNTNLVDTATFDLRTFFENTHQNLGDLRRYELQGFEISESELNNKSYKLLTAHYKLFYYEQNTSSSYTVLFDEPNQKLINFLIN